MTNILYGLQCFQNKPWRIGSQAIDFLNGDWLQFDILAIGIMDNGFNAINSWIDFQRRSNHVIYLTSFQKNQYLRLRHQHDKDRLKEESTVQWELVLGGPCITGVDFVLLSTPILQQLSSTIFSLEKSHTSFCLEWCVFSNSTSDNVAGMVLFSLILPIQNYVWSIGIKIVVWRTWSMLSMLAKCHLGGLSNY